MALVDVSASEPDDCSEVPTDAASDGVLVATWAHMLVGMTANDLCHPRPAARGRLVSTSLKKVTAPYMKVICEYRALFAC